MFAFYLACSDKLQPVKAKISYMNPIFWRNLFLIKPILNQGLGNC